MVDSLAEPLQAIADHMAEMSKILQAVAHGLAPGGLHLVDPPEDSEDPEDDIPSEWEAEYDPNEPLIPDDVVQWVKLQHRLLGSHQEMAVRALAAAYPGGLSAPEINPNASSQPNTYTTLEKLEERGFVRHDDRVHPRQYFLDHRASPGIPDERFLEMYTHDGNAWVPRHR